MHTVAGDPQQRVCRTLHAGRPHAHQTQRSRADFIIRERVGGDPSLTPEERRERKERESKRAKEKEKESEKRRREREREREKERKREKKREKER